MGNSESRASVGGPKARDEVRVHSVGSMSKLNTITGYADGIYFSLLYSLAIMLKFCASRPDRAPAVKHVLYMFCECVYMENVCDIFSVEQTPYTLRSTLPQYHIYTYRYLIVLMNELPSVISISTDSE